MEETARKDSVVELTAKDLNANGGVFCPRTLRRLTWVRSTATIHVRSGPCSGRPCVRT